MTVREWLGELLFPVSSLTTLIALVVFYLLISLVSIAGVFGIWLAVLVVPAVIRYQTMVAVARARGADTEPPTAEFFDPADSWWTLFPTILIVAAALAIKAVGDGQGAMAALLLAFLFAAILPAMISVLVITQSPLQCLNPVALKTLIVECGEQYWFAPLTAVLVVLVPMQLDMLPNWLMTFVELVLLTSFFAVCGAITRSKHLIDEVGIPEPQEKSGEELQSELVGERTNVLNHAYGFVSRDNRTGGLNHIYAWLGNDDPLPAEGWPWFFEQMLKWERNEAALFFAQQYLKLLLGDGQKVAAVKLILRCHLVNDAFRPLAEDMPSSLEAARACGNEELAAVLERS